MAREIRSPSFSGGQIGIGKTRQEGRRRENQKRARARTRDASVTTVFSLSHYSAFTAFTLSVTISKLQTLEQRTKKSNEWLTDERTDTSAS